MPRIEVVDISHHAGLGSKQGLNHANEPQIERDGKDSLDGVYLSGRAVETVTSIVTVWTSFNLALAGMLPLGLIWTVSQ